jgi:F0F1-type ATP synthase membrane subunit a
MTDARSHISTEGASQLNQALMHFSYLQILDFLTTVAFLVNGIKEANPFVRLALKLGPNPVGGLILVKLLAIALGVYCWRLGRQRLLSRINVWFAMLIAWNLVALIVGALTRG